MGRRRVSESPSVLANRARSAAKNGRLMRARVIAGYGGACKCCGERRLILLTMDHINGDGADDRRTNGGNLYRRLLREGLPRGFQVLCFNCNRAKGVGPSCPCSTEVLTAEEYLELT